MTKKETQKLQIKSEIEKKLKNLESVNLTISKTEAEYNALLEPLRAKLQKLQAKIDKGTQLKKGLEQDILTLSSKEEVAGEKIESSVFEIKYKKHTFREYNDEKAIINFLETEKHEELLKTVKSLKKDDFVTWYEKENAKSDAGFIVPGFELKTGLKPSIATKTNKPIK